MTNKKKAKIKVTVLSVEKKNNCTRLVKENKLSKQIK